MLKKAPFLIWPMRFCLPHRPQLRPVCLIRAGLFLYDNLGGATQLPGCKTVYFAERSVLKKDLFQGFEYSDCWVDDARLVIVNIMDAKERGAQVHNRCKVVRVERKNGLWELDIVDVLTQKHFIRLCKVLLNATGPWVEQFFDLGLSITSPCSIRLLKGSHLVVPKVHDEERAYILQNEDCRIVFVLPYLDKFSIIGTTDIEYTGDPRDVAICEDEITYLLDVYNLHFKYQLCPNDVLWTFSGVRPLYDDASGSAQKVTRDYRLELNDNHADEAPFLSVFGGKLTTYRALAQTAVNKLAPFFPDMKGAWTSESVLPGAQGITSYLDVERQLSLRFSWMDTFTAHRLATGYGSRVWVFLDNVIKKSDLGQSFGHGLSEIEIDYLIHVEFAQSAEDVLWRRTKLGLYLSKEQQKQVSEYISIAFHLFQIKNAKKGFK